MDVKIIDHVKIVKIHQYYHIIEHAFNCALPFAELFLLVFKFAFLLKILIIKYPVLRFY